jgi:uncharacterized protein YaaQ
MSQLLIAVVRQHDVDGAIDELLAAGYRVTGFPSFGGFLREDNRTLMVACDDDRTNDVIAIFQRTTHAGEIEVPLVLTERLKDWRAATVQHGGATIFVIDLATIIRT